MKSFGSSSDIAHRSGNSPIYYSPGRKPWFDLNAPELPQIDTSISINPSKAFVIGIAGGSASGKTTVSTMIIDKLDVPWVVLLSMDSFYKCLSPEEIAKAHRNEYNFDDPNAFDYDLLFDCLTKLKQGHSVQVPNYDFVTHSRTKNTRHVYGASVVIFEGIYAFYDQRIIDMMDLKIFVESDDDIRLARRLKRDIAERGRDLNGVLTQYFRFVKPSFDQWIRPTMKHADVIIPRGAENIVAINLITQHIALQLDERGFSIRSKMANLDHIQQSKKIPTSVKVLEMTPQLKYIHTMLRDKECPRDEFVFFIERLARLIVEDALSLLPFEEKNVTTPTALTYKGLTRADNLCGVSIIRAGLTMERPLRKVCPNISIGKILIQTSPISHEPNLHFCHLPSDIKSRKVLLLDSSISTGAAMLMAIRVLMEHGVLEENIIILCFIANPLGLNIICSAFPKINIVVSEIDYEMDMEHYYILPGMGNIGDRYFGTE